jgi:cytochrome b
MLAISLVGAYIVEEDFITLHVAFGYTAGILILFRLIWGIAGPKYSHFRDFPMGVKSITGFIKGFGKPGNVYAGHNPPSFPGDDGNYVYCCHGGNFGNDDTQSGGRPGPV